MKAKIKNSTSQILPKIADKVIEYKKLLLWGLGFVIVFFVCFIPNNQLNDVWVDYFDTKTIFRQNADYTFENLTGLGGIHYSLKAKEEGGISHPEYLAHLDKFTSWLRKQPEVVHVNTLSDTFKRLNKNLHNDEQQWYRLPDSQELAAQYLLLYELSLPYGLDLNNQINIKKSATRLNVTIKKLSTNQLLDLEERASQWLEENVPEWMVGPGTGPDIMFAHIGYNNIRSMLLGSTLALFLISFILCFAFRSLKYGIISLVPNLMPLGISFGIWGIAVGEVGLSLSVVAGMTLGIIVDDTIHFLSKYLRARKERQFSPEEAVRYAFKTVGPALWITTFVLIVGFSILALSQFKLNSWMGMLTAITIAIALLLDFFFLPPLLMHVEGKKHA